MLIAALSMKEWGPPGHETNLLSWFNVGEKWGILQAQGAAADLVALAVFTGLCLLLARAARRKIKGLEI